MDNDTVICIRFTSLLPAQYRYAYSLNTGSYSVNSPGLWPSIYIGSCRQCNTHSRVSSKCFVQLSCCLKSYKACMGSAAKPAMFRKGEQTAPNPRRHPVTGRLRSLVLTIAYTRRTPLLLAMDIKHVYYMHSWEVRDRLPGIHAPPSAGAAMQTMGPSCEP